MHLNENQVAELFGLSVATIRRWVRQGKIPVYRTEQGYVFFEKDLYKWAQAHDIPLSGDGRGDLTETSPTKKNRLASALTKGGILRGVQGDSVSAVLKSVVDSAPLDPVIDRNELFVALIQREELSTTGIGRGVAIPHPRITIPGAPKHASITTCFLAAPVDFGSIDGIPVFVLFLMICPTPKIHLTLLSKLSHLLRDDMFLALLKQKPSDSDFFSAVKKMEHIIDMASRSSSPNNMR